MARGGSGTNSWLWGEDRKGAAGEASVVKEGLSREGAWSMFGGAGEGPGGLETGYQRLRSDVGGKASGAQVERGHVSAITGGQWRGE